MWLACTSSYARTIAATRINFQVLFTLICVLFLRILFLYLSNITLYQREENCYMIGDLCLADCILAVKNVYPHKSSSVCLVEKRGRS